MSANKHSGGRRTKNRTFRRFLFENSIFLIAGAIGALVWANLDYTSYHDFINMELWGAHHEEHAAPASEPLPADAAAAPGDAADHAGGEHAHNTLLFLVNDILMALFFAIAGKEVWEALLPGGPLSSARKAAMPLIATLGGMAGPAGLYILGVAIYGSWNISNGWAIPCATDIAFSYLVARLIFGPGHPAIAFLLLLAIADDAGGLIILAVFYPSKPLEPQWLLMTVGAIALGFGMRKLRLHSFWWYLLGPGVVSWFSFFFAGIHPALGLVPIIPTLPHAHTDLGVFAREELNRHDTLNEFEHWWKNPVELVLGLFGLANAGVPFGSMGLPTGLVLVGLLVGKPLGITLFTWLGEKLFKLQVPKGMDYRDVLTVGMIAGIGFTVALFVSVAAFPASKFPAEILDAAKMGALFSFGAAILSFMLAKTLRVRRWTPRSDDGVSDPGAGDAGGDDRNGEPLEATA